MRKGEARKIALGGLLAAIAVVVMCLVGVIPVATFICPVLCIFLCDLVLWLCGGRIAWAWYVAVAALSLLLGPDKEAASIFAAMGAYPIIKPVIERTRARFPLKLLLFNLTAFILYGLMIYVLGVPQITNEYCEFGLAGLITMLVLGNVTFFLVDRLLTVFSTKRRHYGR